MCKVREMTCIEGLTLQLYSLNLKLIRLVPKAPLRSSELGFVIYLEFFLGLLYKLIATMLELVA